MNEAKIDHLEADAVAVGKVPEASSYTVLTLLGQQATKTAIDAALRDLEKQCGIGGIVLIELIGLFGRGVQYNKGAWFNGNADLIGAEYAPRSGIVRVRQIHSCQGP
ncbi:MAG UNVERIFIED_CONTAM: hypothetical protein LVR18_29630 [Planctomycetaceae bacterium]|jgi:hypothetical protein